MTLKELKKILQWLHPVRGRGYVQFDSPRIDKWEELLRSLGFTPQQIADSYED